MRSSQAALLNEVQKRPFTAAYRKLRLDHGSAGLVLGSCLAVDFI